MINEKTFNNISYGLFVLSAKKGDKDNGCIINTAQQVTASPLCISITVNKTNFTHDMIMETKEFNISVLSEKATFEVFSRYGFASGRDTEKVPENSPRTKNGIIFVPDISNSVISAKVINEVDLGTHTMFIADVTEAVILNDEISATYAYYHKNIKPKPKAVQSEGKKWVCTICGFIYDEAKEKIPFEQLPENWVCPLCKHPKSDFKLME